MKKKTIFPPKKLFRPIFSRITEYEQPEGTKYRGIQAFVTVILQDLRIFGTYDVDENNSSKIYFPEEKQFWPIFSRITDYRVWQTSSKILLGSTRYYGSHCTSFMIFSVTPKRLLRTNFFENMAVCLARKFFRRICSRIIGFENPREQFIRVQQVL